MLVLPFHKEHKGTEAARSEQQDYDQFIYTCWCYKEDNQTD